jgi:hypothetical protein
MRRREMQGQMRFFLFFLLSCSACLAGDHDEIREVLAENFRACNEEDIDALMDTCSMDMPDRPGFRRESAILFGEKDVHYSLVDFRVTKLRGDYAEAWIVQKTYSEDRTSDSDARRAFRNGTTLLPQEETVGYFASFKRERGRWKCLATISEPIPQRKPEPARR